MVFSLTFNNISVIQLPNDHDHIGPWRGRRVDRNTRPLFSFCSRCNAPTHFRNMQKWSLTARTWHSPCTALVQCQACRIISWQSPMEGSSSIRHLGTCWTALWIDLWNRPQSPVRQITFWIICNLSYRIMEDSYLCKDPFNADGGFITLGSHCFICKKTVCCTAVR